MLTIEENSNRLQGNYELTLAGSPNRWDGTDATELAQRPFNPTKLIIIRLRH